MRNGNKLISTTYGKWKGLKNQQKLSKNKFYRRYLQNQTMGKLHQHY